MIKLTKEEIEELVWDARIAVAEKRAGRGDHALIQLHARNAELEARLGAAVELATDCLMDLKSEYGDSLDPAQCEIEVRAKIDSIIAERGRAAKKEGKP